MVSDSCTSPRGQLTDVLSSGIVEAIFGVRVTSVNTLNRKGKSVRNRRTNQMSKRADEKRAVVTLAEGDEIDLFGS